MGERGELCWERLLGAQTFGLLRAVEVLSALRPGLRRGGAVGLREGL